VLATALLQHADQTKAARDKLLSFTDNRQDASLQAGHFNDFVHVSLLRCALYAALLREQELTFDRVARETVLSCGLTIRDIARNPELDLQSPAAQDLRRGWRVVQPNLEHVGLLRVGYRGLEGLCANDAHWGFHPAVAALPPADREALIRTVLDQFRRKLAIAVRCLQETSQQQMRRRAEQHLNEFWGLDPDVNELRTANRFVRLGQSARAAEGFSLNERSTLGRFLRQRLGLTTADYTQFLEALLELLLNQGLLARLAPVDDHQLYQLDAACLLWRGWRKSACRSDSPSSK
jgi:hypothetical protein